MKQDWEVSLYIEGLTKDQIEALLSTIIAVVEKAGGYVGGGIHGVPGTEEKSNGKENAG